MLGDVIHAMKRHYREEMSQLQGQFHPRGSCESTTGCNGLSPTGG